MANKTSTRANEKDSAARKPQHGARALSHQTEQANAADLLARALNAPASMLVPADILALQRTAGNRAVEQILAHRTQHQPPSRLTIQPKLTIGASDNPHEREADLIAATVVQTLESASPPIQRQLSQEDEEDFIVQRQSSGDAAIATPEIETAIGQARGTGQPLEDDLRSRMEQSFGADFSGVRVHTDDRADSLNRSLQARAFTNRNDLFFKRGEYNPASTLGRELIAHELTHVIQQGSTIQRHRDDQGSAGEHTGIRIGQAAHDEGGQVNRKIIVSPGTACTLADDAITADVRDKFLKPYYTQKEYEKDKATSDKGRSVKREAEVAIYAIKPNQGKDDEVSKLTKKLFGARQVVEDKVAGSEAITKKQAIDDLTVLYDATNSIIDNGTEESAWLWRTTAVFEGAKEKLEQGKERMESIATYRDGGAVAALVAIKDKKSKDAPLLPKRLQLSTDRHMWSSLTKQSESKALNSMLKPSVKIDDVYGDIKAIAKQYILLMDKEPPKDKVLAGTSVSRKYLIEKLDAVEPHVFPTDGTDVVTLDQQQHGVLKQWKDLDERVAKAKSDKSPKKKGEKPKVSNEDWDTMVAEVNKLKDPNALYLLMTKLSVEKAKIDALKEEVAKRKPKEKEKPERKEKPAKKK